MPTRLTARLRLEPIRPEHAEDLYLLHQDPAVAEWWDGVGTEASARADANRFATGWVDDGVSKWMAYDRVTGELVGRGGLSRMELDGASRLEVGWVLHARFWGNGYASEIGAAGLAFAFDELGAEEVVAYTEPHNVRSRAVMERLGMTYQRDIVHDDIHFVLYAIPSPVAPVSVTPV
jgi:[ribosomal protein S5]-alanine N-acetyltransferase